ncbi:MAG: hypothetical protein QF718_00690 [Phycisphaerales bacterium]|jgi:hypothetical protein|nr:hypothetical protein [Phycisphaerales bacterium]
MKELVINSTVQHTLLLFVPLVFAFILKLTKIRVWAMLGGVMSGILLGPAVLGAVAPDYWEGIFRGGVLQHDKLTQLQRQQQSDLLAATTLGADETVLLQLKANHNYEQNELKEQWELAQWDDQRTLRNYSILLIVIILLSGRMKTKTRGTAPPLTTLSVGVWAAIIPSGLITLLVYWFLNEPLISSLALGACVGAGPWTLAKWEEETANQAQQDGALLMIRCGRVAWIVASTIAIYSTWQVVGAMSLVWLCPLVLLPFIWVVPPMNWKWLEVFVDCAAIPSVMAASLVLINPFEISQFWPIVFVLLLCADARWLGGIIGLGILGGNDKGNSMKLAIPLVDAGVSQMCMAALLIGVGLLTPSFAVAALIGALFLEYTVTTRMKFAESKDSL